MHGAERLCVGYRLLTNRAACASRTFGSAVLHLGHSPAPKAFVASWRYGLMMEIANGSAPQGPRTRQTEDRRLRIGDLG